MEAIDSSETLVNIRLHGVIFKGTEIFVVIAMKTAFVTYQEWSFTQLYLCVIIVWDIVH
jgi:hypothetical protein